MKKINRSKKKPFKPEGNKSKKHWISNLKKESKERKKRKRKSNNLIKFYFRMLRFKKRKKSRKNNSLKTKYMSKKL